MDLIGSLGTWGGWLAGYVVPFVFVLAIVVFFHELGHFLVARWCGVRVTTFSIGFGPELIGFNDRRGTRWKVCAIPLGGYVKFLGDRGITSVAGAALSQTMNDSDRRETFAGTTVGRRIAIVAAGPIANFYLAILVFAGVFMLYGRETTIPRVQAVQPGGAAAIAGIEPGDLILAIDGALIESFDDLQRVVSASAGQVLRFVVERRSGRFAMTAIPALREVKDAFGSVSRIGMLGLGRSTAPEDTRTERVGSVRAIELGAEQTWFVVKQILRYLSNLVVGRESPDQLGGPIRIAQISGQVATYGLIPLIQLAAILSVSVGLLNLFPVPALDGGHLLFYAIEAARGRPVSADAQKWGLRIGVAAVLALMVLATINDIWRLAAL
jgi:regulator of sigma E protease